MFFILWIASELWYAAEHFMWTVETEVFRVTLKNSWNFFGKIFAPMNTVLITYKLMIINVSRSGKRISWVYKVESILNCYLRLDICLRIGHRFSMKNLRDGGDLKNDLHSDHRNFFIVCFQIPSATICCLSVPVLLLRSMPCSKAASYGTQIKMYN